MSQPDLESAESKKQDAHSLYERGKLEEAKSLYIQASQLNPADAHIWLMLGNINGQSGAVADAESAYRQALLLNPDLGEGHQFLGNLLGSQGRIDEANECYRQALRIKPNSIPAHINLGNTLVLQGKVNEALAIFHNALRIDPNCHKAVICIAHAHMRQGDLKQAFAQLQPLLTPDKAEAEVALFFATICQSLGRCDEAITLIEQLIARKNPPLNSKECSSLYARLAQLYDAKNESDSAFLNYKRGNAIKAAQWRATETTSKVILVTGMHRSATSTLMRICNLLGVRSPGTFMDPGMDNPLGYWEPVEVIDAHNALLEDLGRPWNDARPLPDGWLTTTAAERCRSIILDVVLRDCKGIPVWGLKDPRLSRLLPLWISITDELGCKPYIFHLIRHPDQVVASLRRRASNPLKKGFSLYVAEPYELWTTYVKDAKQYSNPYPHAFITYDALITDWRGTLTSAAERMGFSWPIHPDEAAKYVDAYIDEGRRHQHTLTDVESEQSEAAKAARDLYEKISQSYAP